MAAAFSPPLIANALRGVVVRTKNDPETAEANSFIYISRASPAKFEQMYGKPQLLA